jgi:hypothetical protein
MIRIWPVLVSLAGIIAILAVAIYRIGENAGELKKIKAALFKEDGMLIYVPAIECKQNLSDVEERLDESELLCKRVETIEKDVKKVERQQTINLERNLTIKEHISLCENVNLKIKELLHHEFKEFKKELFAELKPENNSH